MAIVAALLGIAAPVHAQHEHHGAEQGEDAPKHQHAPKHRHAPGHQHHGGMGTMVHTGVHFEAGTVDAFSGSRDYQGLMAMAEVRRGPIEAMAHIPVYRIDLGANTGQGLGDIHIEGRWIAKRFRGVALGVSAGFMPPFGDDEEGLGMGHWMVMAGGFARATRGRLRSTLYVGYGGAPGGGGHAEHGVPVWPPVNPMNAHEIAGKLDLAVGVTRRLSTRATVKGSVPITDDGDNLLLLGGGVDYRLGRYMLGIGAKHGFAAHTADLVLLAHIMTML